MFGNDCEWLNVFGDVRRCSGMFGMFENVLDVRECSGIFWMFWMFQMFGMVFE